MPGAPIIRARGARAPGPGKGEQAIGSFMRIQRLEYIVHEGSHMRVVATRVMLNSTLESALVLGCPEVVSVKRTATKLNSSKWC